MKLYYLRLVNKHIFRAILNTVGLNRLAHVLWSTYICHHVGEILGKGIARSYIHIFVELSQWLPNSFPQWLYQFPQPQQYVSSSCPLLCLCLAYLFLVLFFCLFLCLFPLQPFRWMVEIPVVALFCISLISNYRKKLEHLLICLLDFLIPFLIKFLKNTFLNIKKKAFYLSNKLPAVVTMLSKSQALNSKIFQQSQVKGYLKELEELIT